MLIILERLISDLVAGLFKLMAASQLEPIKGVGSYSGQGGGQSCKRGIAGRRGESRAAGANRAKKAMFCYIVFVNIRTMKT